MIGKIYITGLIGTLPNQVGVELIDIIEQVKKQPEATSFEVYIKSEGGVVDTGFDIYDYLKSLNLPIKTIGSEMVASIATVVFSAGDIRELKPNTIFMVHLPWGGVDGNATEIEQYANDLKSVEKRLINHYKTAINISEEGILPLLKNETFLTLEQCKNLGFATQISEPLQAVAHFNFNNKNNNSMTNEDKNWFESLFNKIVAIGKKAVNLLELTDADGMIITFPDAVEGSDPQIGDKATIDGNPADGTYVMPNGKSFVFVSGELTEILEPETDELAIANEKIADLESQLATVTASLQTAETNFQLQTTAVLNMKKQITSKFNFEEKKDPKEKEQPIVSVAQERLLKLKNK